MKGYSIFPKAPGLESHHQIQFSVISRTLVMKGLTSWNTKNGRIETVEILAQSARAVEYTLHLCKG